MSLDLLPNELIVKICEYLPANDVIAFSQINGRWFRAVSGHGPTWTRLLRQFPHCRWKNPSSLVGVVVVGDE